MPTPFSAIVERSRESQLLGFAVAISGSGIANLLAPEGCRAWGQMALAFVAESLPHLENGIPRGYYNQTHWPLPNVWIGVSVEDQRRARERIPFLQTTPAAVRFLSCEPLLGPLDLTAYLPHRSVYDPHIDASGCAQCGHLPSWHGTDIAWVDWVIAGAESGPHARPMDDDWVRALRDQCRAADTAFFFKQRVSRAGRKEVDPVLDGRQWLELPRSQVQQSLKHP